ncbi:hypothetical protein AGMMS49983_10070 [Clostridia bacterium]|nr:hypothetical protein AGMMS49983_10070 [Clostridia bacterium]
MHIDMKHVGKIIQTARIAEGITQTALADKIGASLRTVIAIESGHRNSSHSHSSLPHNVQILWVVSILSNEGQDGSQSCP